MNLNDALRQIRLIITNLDEEGEKWDDTHKLKELFDGLDEHISNGEELPDEWKKINKPEHMKQNNPKDQQQVILGALEGHIDNLREGISTNIENMQRLIDDLKILLTYLPEEW